MTTQVDALLGSSPLFAGLDADELRAIVGHAQFQAVPDGHVLLSANDRNDKLFILCSGEVRVERAVGDRYVPLAMLGPGQYFGEMSLARDNPTSARLVATRPSETLSVSRLELERLRTERPMTWGKVWHNIALELTRRLATTNEMVAHYVDISRALVEDADFRRFYGQL